MGLDAEKLYGLECQIKWARGSKSETMPIELTELESLIAGCRAGQVLRDEVSGLFVSLYEIPEVEASIAAGKLHNALNVYDCSTGAE